MNNEEINRYIHRNIMQKCQSVNEDCECVPDLYTSDDSPRRLLEGVVAKVKRHSHLSDILEDRFPLGQHYLVTATAEQIATACVEAHKLTANPAA